MDQEQDPGQVRQPCPICGRKFLADRLTVHLRSCDKSNKYAHRGGGVGYDNKAFLDKLDAEMKKEEEKSSYKSSKKEKNDPNKDFLAKLDAEMEKEQKNPGYVPSKQKPKNPAPPKEDSNKAFLDKLDAAMEKEAKESTYKSSKKTKESKEEANNKAFLAKLEKEMEADKGKHYVSYAEQKKKLQESKPQPDYNKNFLDKLDEELKKEDKYKPSNKPKKQPVNDPKKDFESRLNAEMEKEKGGANNKSSSNKQLLCYICYKQFNAPNYVSHTKMCENNWRRNNLGKDPAMMRPEKYNELIQHISTMKDEDIEKYNDEIFKNKDKMTFVPCENCARNILQCKMEEHLKTCKPMFGKVRNEGVSQGGNIQSGGQNLEQMIQDDIKNMNNMMELVPCEKCGRKFAPDRLPVHLRGCKGKK